MSDDLVALRILIVSDSASDREALRNAASQSSSIIDVAELDRPGDPACVREALDGSPVDVVFLDSRVAQDARQTVLREMQAAGAKPLVISVGATSEPLVDGFADDATLAKPIAAADARATLDACVRARMPSRALVVDDSPTVRAVIRKVLQSCRYSFDVEEASDGRAALDAAGKQRFDLVLLDCNMPGLDGFATLAAFLSHHADAKLVMVTGTNDTRTADKARAAGAHDVLYKPFYAKDVDAMMSRLSGLSRPK